MIINIPLQIKINRAVNLQSPALRLRMQVAEVGPVHDQSLKLCNMNYVYLLQYQFVKTNIACGAHTFDITATASRISWIRGAATNYARYDRTLQIVLRGQLLFIYVLLFCWDKSHLLQCSLSLVS